MSKHTSKVKVYNRARGRWEPNAKVVLGWDGIVSLGHSQPAYTNENGIAYVSHASTGTATVYINGREVGSMRTPGEADFSI